MDTGRQRQQFAPHYSISPDNVIHEDAPIGRPVQNTYVRVLNEQANRGRARDSRGIIHRRRRTGGRIFATDQNLRLNVFVRDPFSDKSDAETVETGDTVLILDDGNLEFLGRTDQQVKLRGFRNPTLVKSRLNSRIRGVREAVVVLRAHYREAV